MHSCPFLHPQQLTVSGFKSFPFLSIVLISLTFVFTQGSLSFSSYQHQWYLCDLPDKVQATQSAMLALQSHLGNSFIPTLLSRQTPCSSSPQHVLSTLYSVLSHLPGRVTLSPPLLHTTFLSFTPCPSRAWESLFSWGKVSHLCTHGTLCFIAFVVLSKIVCFPPNCEHFEASSDAFSFYYCS